jgi:membrane-bound metal-dependent hydrolase YbcI (DUF457 family)
MMGPTHIAVGAATALGACALTEPTPTHGAILVAAAVVASKLPDQLEVFGLRHRGPTHYLLTALVLIGLVGVALTFADPETRPYAGVVAAGVAIGYLMHIAADCCTVSGVPVFGPFSQQDRWLLPRRLRVRTGKIADSFLALLACGACLLLVAMLVSPP